MKIMPNISNLKRNIITYVYNNIKEYMLTVLLFIIGIFVGVMIINNCNDSQLSEINTYISEFINKFNNIQNLDRTGLVLSSIKNNIILAIIIWVAGTTVIGIPIVFSVILFRGVCLGYTIAAITNTIGTFKGIGFCIISLCAQNILFIPALLSLGVSSIKLYKSIIKDRRRENIKIEIVRHTIFSILMLFILILSSFIENIISMPLLQQTIKFF